METRRTKIKTLLGKGLTFLFFLVVISHATAQICVLPPSGLLSWWPANGNFDDIQNGNSGTNAGAVTFTSGKVGQAFFFDGSPNSFITLPNSPNMLPASNQLTIETWIKPDFTVNNQWDNILAKRDGCGAPGNSYNLGINKGDPNDLFGAIAFAMSSSSGEIVRATSGITVVPNDGEFHHVAATYDGSVMQVYLDGQLVGQAARSGPILPTTSAAVISHHGGTCGQRAVAAIDELRFYDRALSAAEIEDIFNAGGAGQCTNELLSLTPATLWIGLKNSDDQGTQFDIRTELAINDMLVAEGETRCVTGVTRNPAKAKEVSVEFDFASDGGFTSGDVLSLTVLTRIGTNPDNTKCAGPGGSHSNAVGLRLYYDGTNRPTRFGAEISPDPLRDFFLRSTGTDLFLDTMPPTATSAKFKDSAALNFAGGNPWKEIGTWSITLVADDL